MVTLIEISKNDIIFLKYTETLNPANELRDLFMPDLSNTFSSSDSHGKDDALGVRIASCVTPQPVAEVRLMLETAEEGFVC